MKKNTPLPLEKRVANLHSSFILQLSTQIIQLSVCSTMTITSRSLLCCLPSMELSLCRHRSSVTMCLSFVCGGQQTTLYNISATWMNTFFGVSKPAQDSDWHLPCSNHEQHIANQK